MIHEGDLMLCLDGLLDGGSEEQNGLTDRLQAINPGIYSFVSIT